MRMRQGVFLLALGLALSGCRGSGRVAPETLLARTSEALVDILVGPPPEVRASRTTPLDPPLLQRGAKERVDLAVDVTAFARLAGKAFSAEDIRALERQVVEVTARTLQRRGGFTIRSVPFPLTAPADDATLGATLTPLLQDLGGPQERTSGRGRTLVLVRLTLVDSTGAILAQRDFSSGRDLGARRDIE